ncbi:MAG: hypothetical protein QM704_05400 [Anaeromyxobacteraceae bacterium]
MPRNLLTWAFALLLVAGAGACSTPCQELGYKLCECRGSGATKKSCENAVDDELSRAKPTSAQEDLCDAHLKTCKAPSGEAFCTWVSSEQGKIACGIALPDDASP